MDFKQNTEICYLINVAWKDQRIEHMKISDHLVRLMGTAGLKLRHRGKGGRTDRLMYNVKKMHLGLYEVSLSLYSPGSGDKSYGYGGDGDEKRQSEIDQGR